MICQESRNKCDGIQLFIRFRKTQQFILKIMLKVSNLFFPFSGERNIELCKTTKSDTENIANGCQMRVKLYDTV